MKRLLLALPWLLFGCSKDCSLVGCATYVEFTLSTPLKEPGAYHIRVEADGEKMECEVSIPASSDDFCDDKVGITREESSTGGGGAGGEGGNSGEAIEIVGVIGEYDRVSISIEYLDELIAEDEIEPDYQEVKINGPDCAGCPLAQYELEVSE